MCRIEFNVSCSLLNPLIRGRLLAECIEMLDSPDAQRSRAHSMKLNEVEKLSQNNVIKELFERSIDKKLWVAPMAGGLDYL